MDKERAMSPDEVSASIVAGVGFVFDLFNEIGSFIRYLQDALEASDLNVGKPLNSRLTVARKRVKRSFADRWLQTDFGLMVQIEAEPSDDDALEDDYLDEEDEEDEGEQESKRSRRKVSITSETQLIGIRANLYDPRQAKSDAFKPVVLGAFLGSLERAEAARRRKAKARSTARPNKPLRKFEVSANGLSKLLAQLEPGLTQKQRITCRIPRYELSATVSGVVQKDLGSFDSEERIDEFVQALVRLTENT